MASCSEVSATQQEQRGEKRNQEDAEVEREESESPSLKHSAVSAESSQQELQQPLALLNADPPHPPVRKPTQFSVRSHSDIDFTKWSLNSSGRNKYGNLIWNIRAQEYDGNVFCFHELPGPNGPGDNWSTVVYDVKAENSEGASTDKVKIVFEISDAQEASMKRFDAAIIDMVDRQSAEVFSQKVPMKKELIESQHYKSPLIARTDTWRPKVRMSFVVRNSEARRLGTMRYIKLQSDGETYDVKNPIVARGWDEIEPLITGHFLRGAQIRAIMVRCWTINILKKEIYPTVEIKEMWVREPKNRAPQYVGLSEEQIDAMNSMP